MRRLLTTSCLFFAVFFYGATPSWAAAPVTIPSNYVYMPGGGSLHDYCTSSFDFLPVENRELKKGSVDNRGPCARHDLCYEGTESKKVCDDNFYADLLQQCDYTFDGDRSGFRQICRTRAVTYYTAVRLYGHA